MSLLRLAYGACLVAHAARVQQNLDVGAEDVSNATVPFACPEECQECGHGRGLPHKKKHKKEFQCVLKKPFLIATIPVDRKCSCPYGWKCAKGSAIAKSAPSSKELKDVMQHQMAITQCEFFDNEKKDKAQDGMLTQKNWVSSKHRCCCGTNGAWSDSKCLPLEPTAARVIEGAPVFGNVQAGIAIMGTEDVLGYGKMVRASGAVENDMVPIEGGGQVPLHTVIVGVEEESSTSGKVEIYVPTKEQTFANSHMSCQKPGNQALEYNMGWTSKNIFLNTGCCVKTEQRTHVETYVCGQVYDKYNERWVTKYCKRYHNWIACASWENVHHCRGAMAEQTGQLALRVDVSLGLCIGDRSTVESLEEQYGQGSLNGYAVKTPGKIAKFALRYDAKKAKGGRCPVNWKPSRTYKNAKNTAGTMATLPTLKFFCSCEHACLLSD